MDPRWERMRVSLLQHVESAEAQQELAELSATLHALSGCARARDAIVSAQQSRQTIEDTSRSLIHEWQAQLQRRQTIGAFLMLCLWRRLTSLYYGQRSYWIELEDELASEILRSFLHVVSDPVTERAPLVSETLVFRTEQRVIDTRRRQLRVDGERRRRSQLPDWALVSARPSAEITRFELTDTIEAIGREAGVEVDLLIDVFRSDHDYDVVAARRGAAREDIQADVKRLLHRIRMHVDEKATLTAVFGSETPFSSGSLEIEGANDNAHDGGSNDDDDGNRSGSGGR
jgi:hypothetical protein